MDNTTMTTEPEEAVVADGSGAMFDGIAERYDRLNRIMSFGLDKGWRRALRRAVARTSAQGGRILDVATGTADVALDLAQNIPGVHVTGLDPSAGMLAVGEEKLAAASMETAIRLVEGDAQDMPFKDNVFDASCIAFGIRNVPDRLAGLREMRRVTRSGGCVAVLELSEPRGTLLSPFARFHVRHVVPRLGAWLSGPQAYAYLQQSIADFPPPETFVTLMERAGIENVKAHRMSFGAAYLFVGNA